MLLVCNKIISLILFVMISLLLSVSKKVFVLWVPCLFYSAFQTHEKTAVYDSN